MPELNLLKPLLTPTEVAKYYRVHVGTIYNWIDDGLLPCTKLPCKNDGKPHKPGYRIKRETLEQLTQEIAS
jgi:excisionase family DNA binding protein